VVLAELAGFVSHPFQHRGNRDRLGGQADRRASLADCGHTRADGEFAGDEVGAARRAARLGVVVGEYHSFFGELIEVRGFAGHQAAVVCADVPHPDIVAHDDDDVGLFGLGMDEGIAADENGAHHGHCSDDQLRGF
jgi:hypothetical protein